MTFYILYWIPMPIQFASFALLPLFYLQLLWKRLVLLLKLCWKYFWEPNQAQISFNCRKWNDIWPWLRFFYSLITVGITLFFLIWAVLAAEEEKFKSNDCPKSANNNKTLDSKCLQTEFTSIYIRIIISALFFILAAALSVQAYYVSVFLLIYSYNFSFC